MLVNGGNQGCHGVGDRNILRCSMEIARNFFQSAASCRARVPPTLRRGAQWWQATARSNAWQGMMRDILGVAVGLVCWLVLVSYALGGNQACVDVVRFDVPSNWLSQASGNNLHVLVAPDGGTNDKAIVAIAVVPQPANQSVELRDILDQTIKTMSGDKMIAKKTDVVSGKSGQGDPFVSQNLIVSARDGQSAYVSVLVTQSHQRFVAFCFLATSQDLFTRHYDDYARMLGSVQIGDVTQQTAMVSASTPFRSPDQVLDDERALRKPGKICGYVYNSRGQPFDVKGARLVVIIVGISKSGDSTAQKLSIDIDKDGYYEHAIVGGHWRVLMEARVPFNGQMVDANCFDMLDGQDEAQSTDDGIVKNFAFKPSGLKTLQDPNEPLNYLGNAICVNNEEGVKSPGEIRIVLTPKTPLIDGTQGQSIVLNYTAQWPNVCQSFQSIPHAVYDVTATLSGPDGSIRPLNVALGMGLAGTSWSRAVTIDFGNNYSLNIAVSE
jgi:hypothetical protein